MIKMTATQAIRAAIVEPPASSFDFDSRWSEIRKQFPNVAYFRPRRNRSEKAIADQCEQCHNFLTDDDTGRTCNACREKWS